MRCRVDSRSKTAQSIATGPLDLKWYLHSPLIVTKRPANSQIEKIFTCRMVCCHMVDADPEP